jgi:hypothetical protein
MKKFYSAVLVNSLILSASSLPAHAQPPQQQMTQAEVKVKSKGGVVRVINKSKPALNAAIAELEIVFAARLQAYLNKDYVTLVSQVSPDYTATRPNGQTVSYEQIKDYIRINLERFISIKNQQISIENIRLNGNEAVVDVRQTLSRFQKLGEGTIYVESGVLQTETWVKGADGWKLSNVTNEREQTLTVNGKPIDPGKPYNPGDPPYVPKNRLLEDNTQNSKERK